MGLAMPRYYFDIYVDDKLLVDEFGVELDSLGEAREQAIALLPDLVRDDLPSGERHDYEAVVRCPEDRPRYRATLSYRGEWIDPPAGDERQ